MPHITQADQDTGTLMLTEYVTVIEFKKFDILNFYRSLICLSTFFNFWHLSIKKDENIIYVNFSLFEAFILIL